MTWETLIVALIFAAVGYVIVTKFVPEPGKTIAWLIYGGAVLLWLVTHIHALLHCCSTG